MKIDQPVKKYLDYAIEAAVEAGNFLSNYNRKKIEIINQDKKDLKILPDKESESIIVNNLERVTDFTILCEEVGMIKRRGGGLRWIIDPLDGSLNFLRNIPACCVSIALWEKNKPILGVVYDFNKKDLYYGVIGGGAWLNGNNIKVSEVGQVEQAILTTGFPSETDFNSEALGNYIRQIQSFKKIRLLGSAALSLAYVACGRADAYFEKDIKLWDVAAGIAIVSAAGGNCKVISSARNKNYDVLALNNKLNLYFNDFFSK